MKIIGAEAFYLGSKHKLQASGMTILHTMQAVVSFFACFLRHETRIMNESTRWIISWEYIVVLQIRIRKPDFVQNDCRETNMPFVH